jgi:CBS domain-containing protein
VVAVDAGAAAGDAAARALDAARGRRHQAFPVVDDADSVLGVVTREELLAAPADAVVASLLARPAIAIFEDESLRDAADRMARHRVGRLPVLTREDRPRLAGILTRSDLVHALRLRLDDEERAEAGLRLWPRAGRG